MPVVVENESNSVQDTAALKQNLASSNTTTMEVEPKPEEVTNDQMMKDFVEDDEIKGEEDISGDGGIKKKILKAGEGWKTPEKVQHTICN